MASSGKFQLNGFLATSSCVAHPRLMLQSWRNDRMSPRPHSLLLSVQLNAVVIGRMACAPPPAPWYFLVSFLHRGANTTQSPPHTHGGHGTESIPNSNSSSSWAELPAAMHQKQACYYCGCHTKTGQIVIFLLFQNRVSLCGCGCPGTHYVDRVGLELLYRPLPPKCSDWEYVPSGPYSVLFIGLTFCTLKKV